MFALLLALAWPAPCAADVPCWLTWDPTQRVEWYEVWSDDRLCASLAGRWYTRRDGTQVFHPPRPVYWPHPGDGCWSPGGARNYFVRACNAYGCGGASETVEFGPQTWRCFGAAGEVPCSTL